MFEIEEVRGQGANIKVIGVGGAGGNAVNNMIASNLHGVEFIAVNTDSQILETSLATAKVQIGMELTKGLGAGSNPDIGREAALEDREAVAESIRGADMVFITAGMGGGTGTGASPVVASVARELGALTVAIVTKPFFYEGRKRGINADIGMKELQSCVDAIIVVPNDRIGLVVEKGTPMLKSFAVANDVLRQAVQGISDLILIPGLINLDFADVKAIMTGMGQALMGTGIGKGENKAVESAQNAVSSPLLEESSIDGARGVLINIIGGPGLTIHDATEASSIIQKMVHEDANIIWGAGIDEGMEDEMRVTVIATGFGQEHRREIEREEKVQKLKVAAGGGKVIDMPVHTSVRHKKSNGAEPATDRMGPLFSGEMDFDIPTFLRRQAD